MNTDHVREIKLVLDGKEVKSDINGRQENRSDAAKDEKAHAGLLSVGVPFVFLLKIDESVNGKAELCDC